MILSVKIVFYILVEKMSVNLMDKRYFIFGIMFLLLISCVSASYDFSVSVQDTFNSTAISPFYMSINLPSSRMVDYIFNDSTIDFDSDRFNNESNVVDSFGNNDGEFKIQASAYYPFNGNANDESVNSNNGTVTGATLTTDHLGTANNAYSFDGNDYITTDLLESELFDASKKLTIHSIFKSTSNGQRMIFSTGQSGDNRLYAWTNGDILLVNIGNNSVSTGVTITEGQWYYLTVVIDGLNAEIYLGNSNVQSKSFS